MDEQEQLRRIITKLNTELSNWTIRALAAESAAEMWHDKNQALEKSQDNQVEDSKAVSSYGDNGK